MEIEDRRLPARADGTGRFERLARRAGLRVVESGLVFAIVLAGWLGAQSRGRVPEASTPGDDSASAPLRLSGVEAPADLEVLRAKRLSIPVDGVAADRLVDSFADARGERTHEAIDILAPRGTPVLAVEDGVIAKLYTSTDGGLTIYQFDPGQRFAYYYAHLDRYAPSVREGEPVERGEVIGFVGTTGNAPADAPHLHFAVYRLGPERRWWRGEPLNPYPVLHGD